MYGNMNVKCNYVFLCISEQTAFISLYSINWLAFMTETENVYCAVRTGYLYVISICNASNVELSNILTLNSKDIYIHVTL